ncbi:hypothetical protein MA16_Dca027713 [Dendrobium catenatum]|uniref:Uncharacterized protein n=1 Tax=Dendrobium catenatum TaxID=906689 RepID=A0A2I0W1I4_9ASPA|nr:hypothetical protein MA16_Dca027713 [Dendrobium catenatum]
MAMKACFSLSTASSEASAFHSHRHLIFSKKKPSSNSACFPYPHPKSFHFESKKKNEQKQFFVCRCKNIVDEVLEVTDETWKEHIIDREVPVRDPAVPGSFMRALQVGGAGGRRSHEAVCR